MRPDNRHDPGGGRRYRLVAAIAILLTVTATLPAVCLPSAMGSALWQKVDLSAYTTLGILRLKLSTVKVEAGLQLDQVKIELDGKTLHIPDGIDLKLPDPQLNSVEVVTTRSITCLDDECPDPSGWPIYVDLPYGDYVVARDGDECAYSLLRIDIQADGISEITRWDCTEGRQVERVLYERKDASDR